MSEERPIYSDHTTRIAVELHWRSSDNAASIRLTSTDHSEDMPAWLQEGADQRDALVKTLKHQFGDTNVEITRPEDSTDRIIIVKAKSEMDDQHIPQVNATLVRFVEENQMELDNNSPRHFRDLVNGAAQMKLRDGIRAIINDQLTYGDEKVDAIMELLKQRRDKRRDERGH
jgi:hypothetical protein